MKLSPWTMELHCSFRYVLETDPNVVANRVAYIEKTPRVRVRPFTEQDDFLNWQQGPKGSGDEYGLYQPSRDWCDNRLIQLGYELTD